MFEKIKKMIRYPYYYVNPCPVCGKHATGRIIKDRSANDTEWQIRDALKNGELVKIATSNNKNNCFCLDCMAEWYGTIQLRWLTKDDINLEREKRATNIMYSEFIKIKKAEKKEYTKKHPISSPIKNFIGKI